MHGYSKPSCKEAPRASSRCLAKLRRRARCAGGGSFLFLLTQAGAVNGVGAYLAYHAP